MPEFISKTELETQKNDSKKSHNAGEIYPTLFSHSKNLDFNENMPLEAGIIWLGCYLIDNKLFPRQKCPVCGKEEVLIPYKAIGSMLSGCHTIEFYCTNCHEQFVTNNHIDYFRSIKQYVANHINEFSEEQKLNKCSVRANSQ